MSRAGPTGERGAPRVQGGGRLARGAELAELPQEHHGRRAAARPHVRAPRAARPPARSPTLRGAGACPLRAALQGRPLLPLSPHHQPGGPPAPPHRGGAPRGRRVAQALLQALLPPCSGPAGPGPRRAGCAGRREVPPGHPRTRASGLSVPAGRRGLQPQGARVRAPDDPHRREAPPLPSTATEGPSRAACAARPPWARPPSSCTAGSTRERNPNRAGGVARPSVRHQPARTAHRRIRTGRGPASAGRAAGPSGALGTSPAPRRPTGPEGACLPPESPPLSIG